MTDLINFRNNPSEVINKNADGDAFPLLFAKRICVASGLWENLAEPDSMKRFYQNEKLKEFQQMAITCTFEASLIAYHGAKLEEDHLDGLAIIHKATKAWLKGEVVGVLMKKISDRKITNRDFAASIAIIMEQLQDEKDTGKGSSNKRGKELVVRLSKMEDIAAINDKEDE